MTNILPYMSEDGYELTRAHPTDAGLDIRSNETVFLKPGERHLTETGITIALPPGTVGYVTPRSGLAHKKGITVLNAPGTVDEHYRGELMVNLINLDNCSQLIQPGDRIAQLVIHPIIRPEAVRVAHMETGTDRGTGGHGSTGTN